MGMTRADGALTRREWEVALLIAEGASNKEAGRRLGISPRTVEQHRANIMAKLGARNAADLVRIVLSGSLEAPAEARQSSGCASSPLVAVLSGRNAGMAVPDFAALNPGYVVFRTPPSHPEGLPCAPSWARRLT